MQRFVKMLCHLSATFIERIEFLLSTSILEVVHQNRLLVPLKGGTFFME